jgi:hypothetical protein
MDSYSIIKYILQNVTEKLSAQSWSESYLKYSECFEVYLSVNFYIIYFAEPIFAKLHTNCPLIKILQVCVNEWQQLSPREDNGKKIILVILTVLFSWTNLPISNMAQIYIWVKGIVSSYSVRGPIYLSFPFQREEIITKNAKRVRSRKNLLNHWTRIVYMTYVSDIV